MMLHICELSEQTYNVKFNIGGNENMIINRNLPPIGMNQQRAGQSFHIKTKPNFGVGGMPTKGASNMSDAELRTAFEELAKRDFAAGKNLSQAYHGSEHQDLMRLVASAASPDRRGIISNTLSDLSSKIQRMMPTFNMNRTCILQMLMQRSNLFPNNRDIGNNFINFRDSKGELVAMYSELPPFLGGGMGFMAVNTPAETARYVKFREIYNDAFAQAKRDIGSAAHNETVKAQGEALDEYSRLAAEVELNPSAENIEAKNAARAAFEAATHRLVNINIEGNKVVIGNSRKADGASITAALERVAPGSTQESTLNVKV